MKAKKFLTVVLILGGLFVTANKSCACPNQNPVAILYIQPDYVREVYVMVNDVVTFDGSDSYDIDGSGGLENLGIKTYEWDFSYTGEVFNSEHSETYPDTDGKASYTYTTRGTYTVKLRVTDFANASSLLNTVECTCTVHVRKIWYVDSDRSPIGDGSSWAFAFKYLQSALIKALSGDEIRVAKGTYKPSILLDPRTARFQLINGVTIKGGYAGYGEPDPDARDITAYETILSGDILVEKDNADNTYHVVTGSGTNATAILDGFTITGGNANGGGQYDYGGGMYNNAGSPTINNCTFAGNTAFSGGGGMCNTGSSPALTDCTFSSNLADFGGGMYNNSSSNPILVNCTFSGNSAVGPSYGDAGGMANQSSSPVLNNCTFSGNIASGCNGGGMSNQICPAGYPKLTNCIFSGNQSATNGGGMHNYHSSPTLTSCIFSGNKAVDYYGGGMDNYSSSSPTLRSCVFCDNSAGERGGGVHNEGYCSPTLTNCTFSGNSAGNCGGGILNYINSSPALTNCILWDDMPDEIYITMDSNPTITYCCVEGGWPGGTNTSDNPQFVDVGNFHLGLDSPCLNAGDPGGNYQDQTDIDGERRVLCLRVDMGADEVLTPIHVDGAEGSSNGDGLSWGDRAQNNLQYVLTNAADGEEIWVAKGTYKPTTNPSDRAASFILKPNMSVYGGFNGDETSTDERKLFNETTASILSGDIDNDDSGGIPDNGNSYHVVKGANGAVLDGFVIMGGYANSIFPPLYNCGGGMLNYTVSPIVRNCSFLSNYALCGGGIFNGSSTAQMTNCIFSGNKAWSYGAGMYNNGANTSIASCTFSQNQATYYGGAIYNYYSAPSVVSSIIWGNTATTGNSIHNIGTNKPYISYSNVQGCGGSPPGHTWNSDIGTDGGKNIDIDPMFTEPDGRGPDNIAGTFDDDLSLQSGSPCMDFGIAGENMGVNWQVDATVIGGPVTVTNPVDLVVSPDGHIYVLASAASPSHSHVFIYDDQLVQQSDLDIGVDATNPKGIAVNADNSFYIADTGGNRILKYTSAGVLDSTFGGDGQFNGPSGIAIDWDGYIYVTDSGNNRVQIFKPDGDFDSKWGEFGSDDGKLSNPTGFCLFGSSEIYLADTSHYRIQNLSAKSGYFYTKVGEFGIHSGQFNNPQDASYDLQFDQLIVADTSNNRIQIFQLNHFGGAGSREMMYVDQIKEIAALTPAALSGPLAVACKSSDTKQILYIADTGHNRVVKVEVEKGNPGRSPLHVWALFKAALWTGDRDKALTFVAEISREKYAEIFQILQPHLQDYVTGMGEMTLSSCEPTEVKYEMLHQDGPQTLSFPVFFIKDEDGNWRIFNF